MGYTSLTDSLGGQGEVSMWTRERKKRTRRRFEPGTVPSKVGIGLLPQTEGVRAVTHEPDKNVVRSAGDVTHKSVQSSVATGIPLSHASRQHLDALEQVPAGYAPAVE